MSLPHPMPDPPRAARDKLRLVVIGATYASEEPRKKLAALAEHFDLTCLTSDSYTGYGIVNRLADQPPPTNYRLVGLPATGRPDTTTRYLLRGLGRALCEHPADLILVETEPWAWLRWHVWLAKTLWQPRARFGEFSWENARRPGWRGTVLSLVYRAAVATADFVIAGNRDAGDFFLQAGLAADRLLVAPQLGVDTEHFRPASPPERAGLRAEMGCDEGDFLVGFCGRMEEEKGVMDLLHAVRQARGTEPLAAASGGQMRLALLGPRGALTPQLEAWQAEYPWLRLYPARTHAGIAAFMQALDLFVLPSHETQPPAKLWKEQFGHVLIEAMACGTMTLGADSGAIPDVLQRPDMLYPWREPERLAARLGELAALPAAARAELAAAQRAHTLAHYTNARLAADWAVFLRGQAEAVPAPDRPPRVCVLGDQRILHTGNRPRRFLDHFQAEADGEVEVRCMIAARDDEELQRKFRFLKTPRARAYLSYALTPWHTLRSLLALRRAEFVCCEGPHYFWTLVFLNRLGVLPVRGQKTIWCLFFPHTRFVKKLGLLNASPTGFRPFFITQEQIRLLEARGAAPGRIRRLDWKVDANWFHPAATPTRDFILCPGNIHRDDGLIAALVGRLDLPLVRAGRMNFLRERFAPFAGRGDFRVEINLDHQAYRRLVQNAAVIILPIEPCDEPAGLTAALEALACRTPILANASLGVGPLLERVGGPGILLPDLSPETWRAAIARTLTGQKTGDSPLLDAGRRFVEECHAIESEKQDWRDFVRQATI